MTASHIGNMVPPARYQENADDRLGLDPMHWPKFIVGARLRHGLVVRGRTGVSVQAMRVP